MNIELHIERLILDGLAVSPRQQSHIQAAVEAELTRLLTADGLSSGLLMGAAIPHLTAPSIRLTAQANPRDLGRQIAGAVHGQIGKPKR